jgi:hypothetical protein
VLFGTPHHAPDIVTIDAGTLDDPSRFKAGFVQFMSERHQLDVQQPETDTASVNRSSLQSAIH